MHTLPEKLTTSEQNVETQRDVLMDILSRHLDNDNGKIDNRNNGNTDKKENRRSVTTSRSAATSRTTGRSSIRQNSIRNQDKVAHIRIASQSSISTIDIPPTPPPKGELPKPPAHKSKRHSRNQGSSSKSCQILAPHSSNTIYARLHSSEHVSLRQPSCVGLPPTWNSIHDRFITYLATHAPLDKYGRVPKFEEKRERWSAVDMARMAVERFSTLEGFLIKSTAIEMRLQLLDESGNNDYFQMKYGAYKFEEWGHDI